MSDHCDEALAKVYYYLDGELDAHAVSKIRAHLEDCPPCEDAFSFEERLRVVVRQRLKEDVPQVVIERLHQVIATERAGD